MAWLASPGVGILTYFLVGAISDGEPMLVRAGWAIVAGGTVLLLSKIN